MRRRPSPTELPRSRPVSAVRDRLPTGFGATTATPTPTTRRGPVSPARVADRDERSALSQAEFERALSALGPFEPAPALAVAVSGGPDSMALCHLAGQWARARGGSILALTVDHGLRAGSTAEAERLRDWLTARHVPVEILTWDGSKPESGVQEAARRARYDLLTARCRRAGILHLLLGHHRRDQAETVAMRKARAGGRSDVGLAAMASVVETPSVRLLRPLLAFPPGRLRALLQALGQPWMTDPSNLDHRFERARVRAALARDGALEPALAKLAGRMARNRIRRDRAAADLAARGVRMDPAGFADIESTVLVAAAPDVATTALRDVIACVGGRAYPPSRAKVARLLDRVVAAREGGSLGRCAVSWQGETLLVCREHRDLPRPALAEPGSTMIWDGRFLIRLVAPTGGGGADTRLEVLGESRARQLRRGGNGRPAALPVPVAAALPALVDEGGVVAVPHLGYRRAGAERGAVGFAKATFRPRLPVAGAGCFLAYKDPHIMS